MLIHGIISFSFIFSQQVESLLNLLQMKAGLFATDDLKWSTYLQHLEFMDSGLLQ